MKFLTVLAAIIIATTVLYSSGSEKYSSIKIFVPDKLTLNKIWETGIDYEGSKGKIGGWMEFIAGQYEMEQLSARGITFSILVDNLNKEYQSQLTTDASLTSGFGNGSMGGYYTFNEVLNQLDSMKLLYPQIISNRVSIGKTHEDREIWSVKISDNPDDDETDEPKVLFTSLTHAREPEGMMTVLYYMWWLLENYGTNNKASYLVNNREIYFIPVINPDGYVYNQTNSPSGGGLWRKNRRDNGSGSYGVDLNRNYGTYEMWDAPNGGSSSNIFSDTYRGPGPFSEPEINAMQLFLWNHQISTCLNYHTYSNLLVYPWGYLSRESDDSITYREFAYDMVGDNRYVSGTDMQTVNYSTRGNSDDYMYGGGFTRTFAMTPEAGPSFWPPSSQILPLAKENLSANIYITSVAGAHIKLKSTIVSDENNDGCLSSGENFYLKPIIRNKGLQDGKNVSVSLTTNSLDILFISSSEILNLIPSRSDTTLSFSGKVISDVEQNKMIDVYIDISSPDGYQEQDTIHFMIGYPHILFSDDGINGLTRWQSGSNWGVSSTAYSEPNSISDSPSGSYSNSSDNNLTMLNEISLNGYHYVFLRFWTKWSIEPSSDIGKIQITTDNGLSWQPLKSDLMHKPSGIGKQITGDYGFDGYTPGSDWIFQEIDLSLFVNHRIKIRFILSSDGSDSRDGWYLDDINITGYSSPFPTLTITESNDNSIMLAFGEIAGATDSLDKAFGEDSLPPKPSAGIFDARWQLAGTNGTLAAIYDTLGGDHVSNIFITEIQPGSDSYPIKLNWNRTRLQTGGWHLRDGETHGTMFNVNMNWTDNFELTNISVRSIEIVHSLIDTLTKQFNAGWQMVSIPIFTPSRNMEDLFPGINSPSFRFQGGYETSTSFDYKEGYWVKFPEASTLRIAGSPIYKDTITIGPGWWILSGLSCPVDLRNLNCDSKPCLGWTYDFIYSSDIILKPGGAFWIKGPNTINLSCASNNTLSRTLSSSASIETKFNSITVTDVNNMSSTIYFGTNIDGYNLSQFELPPIPPTGSFDVRFSSNKFVENFSSYNQTEQKKIFIQASAFPVSIRWDIANSSGYNYYLSGKDGSRRLLMSEGSMSDTNPEDDIFILEKGISTDIPKYFSVYQNYPNPFNPTTIIKLDLPEQATVSMVIYDVLGKELRTIISGNIFEPGSYDYTIQADDLSSGIYLCRITFRETKSNQTHFSEQKMILLK
jgi:carboxypeptidase T